MTELPMKWRVFRLLTEGGSIPTTAARLNLKRQTVHSHALWLERHLIVKRRSTPRGSLLFFERGPRANEADAAIETCQSGDRVGRVGRQPPPASGARVHRGGYKFAVLEGPRTEPPWQRSWNPNRAHVGDGAGATDFSLRVGQPDGVWRFWMKRDERGRAVSLMVQPPEVWAFDPAAVRRVAGERAERARAAAGGFAKEYGLKFASSRGTEIQETEYGIPASGLPTFGRPGVDAVWADESPGDGQVEVETADPQVAASILALPRWMSEVTVKQKRTEDELLAHRMVIQRAIELQEEQAMNERLVASALTPRAPPKPLKDDPAVV